MLLHPMKTLLKRVLARFPIWGPSFFSILISTVFLFLSFPGHSAALFAWIGLIPFLRTIRSLKLPQAAGGAYCFGILLYGALIYWLYHVTFIGLIALVLYLSLYPCIFAVLFKRGISRHQTCTETRRLLPRPLTQALYAASLWVLLEYIQGHLLTGFGWCLLGHSQYTNNLFTQIADITGVYGVSFLVMMANSVGAEIVDEVYARRPASLFYLSRDIKQSALIVFLVISLVLGYGVYRLRESHDGYPVTLSVIQGNIPQHEKWDAELAPVIFSKYQALTRMAALESPDLIIWPETATPGYFTEPHIRTQVEALARENKTPLLVGSPECVEEGMRTVYYNSAFLLSQDGVAAGVYRKLHLVPFGEYVPLSPLIDFVFPLDQFAVFSPGDEFVIFNMPKGPQSSFGVLICFEDIFPGLVRRFVLSGADFLVNITNDAWFGKTSAPYQHAAASVFRAIENRRWVIRCANTGVSCFISPHGIMKRTLADSGGEQLFTTVLDTYPIRISQEKTFYTRWGDVWLFFPLTFCILYTVPAWKKQ
ncbi:MAG: apolipoprotein N-acyltransferase [Candidatus Omnitrophica bacterium]|nr:apolipoprotein N-acyltransferase [Candidatus Omnitrophota bacterium]